LIRRFPGADFPITFAAQELDLAPASPSYWARSTPSGDNDFLSFSDITGLLAAVNYSITAIWGICALWRFPHY